MWMVGSECRHYDLWSFLLFSWFSVILNLLSFPSASFLVFLLLLAIMDVCELNGCHGYLSKKHRFPHNKVRFHYQNFGVILPALHLAG